MQVAVVVAVDIEKTEADMFERSFIDTDFTATNRRRGWTTLVSMALQTALVAVLILLPLLYTEALPRLINVVELAPPPPPAPRGGGGAPIVRRAGPAAARSEVVSGRIHVPSATPTSIKAEGPGEAAPYSGGETGIGQIGVPEGPGFPGGVPGGLGLVPPRLVAVNRPVLAAAPQEKRVAVSEGLLEGFLIRRVVPVYPPLARNARVQGVVLLQAVISREGTIEGLRLASGHPLLTQAAMDAVRQWRYKPYMLNREPVEVETEITVKFTLGQ